MGSYIMALIGILIFLFVGYKFLKKAFPSAAEEISEEIEKVKDELKALDLQEKLDSVEQKLRDKLKARLESLQKKLDS